MDVLEYRYNSTNKLLKVIDTGNKSYGFKDGTNTNNDYTYDVNGNLTSDANKGITGVTYNHLNLPTEIKFNNSNTQKMSYIYTADGIKVRKVVNNGGNVTTTDYDESYVYENNQLKQVSYPGGYFEPKVDGGYQYVYRYVDIWGNTRMTYADDNGDGIIEALEIRREQNYYPFGLEHRGYNGRTYGVKNNLKTYQGQELTEDLGLNTHEWKYRVSDPAIGRFWQIDPLAEDYTYNSTYAFQENKLGMGIELEGLEMGRLERYGDDIIKDISALPPLPEQSKQNFKNAVKGAGNVTFGTVGAIGSIAYIAGSSGIGAALGGATALSLSVTEIGIGIGQIADAVTNDSGYEALQKSSSLPGLVAHGNNSENAELIDAAGQFIPGMLSGGNLKTIVQEGGTIVGGKGTLLGTAGAVDAVMDTAGVIDALSQTNNSSSTTNNTVKKIPSSPPPLISSDLEDIRNEVREKNKINFFN